VFNANVNTIISLAAYTAGQLQFGCSQNLIEVEGFQSYHLVATAERYVVNKNPDPGIGTN
jgi:hypothetical protein